MNDLESYFNKNTDRVIDKWIHYFEVYERHFTKYRGKEIVICEIGIFNGGSLQMWKDYFGDKAKIYGIDINPNCKEVEEENVTILIGSQSDRDFLKTVKEKIPPIDILIDDGGHTMLQQIVSFEELFDHVKPDGVYLCEDIHTSYVVNYGGGLRRQGSFIEYSKNFIDRIHEYHFIKNPDEVSSFTKSVHSLHYYDSILVIEKRPTPKPYSKQTGTVRVDFSKPKPKGLALLNLKAKHAVNKLLWYFKLPFRNGDLN
jgi:Methyltransferase domain